MCLGSSKNTAWKKSFHPHLCWSFPQLLGQPAFCWVVTEALVVAQGWTEKVTTRDNYSLKVIKNTGKPQLGKQVKHRQPYLHTAPVRLCWLPSSYLAHAWTPCTIFKYKVFLSWPLQLPFTWGSISIEIVSPSRRGAEPDSSQHHLVLHKSSPQASPTGHSFWPGTPGLHKQLNNGHTSLFVTVIYPTWAHQ